MPRNLLRVRKRAHHPSVVTATTMSVINAWLFGIDEYFSQKGWEPLLNQRILTLRAFIMCYLWI